MSQCLKEVISDEETDDSPKETLSVVCDKIIRNTIIILSENCHMILLFASMVPNMVLLCTDGNHVSLILNEEVC